MPMKKIKQVKKLKRDANGKFAGKAVKEAAKPAGIFPTGTPLCEPGATCGRPTAPEKEYLHVVTSYESSTSAAIVAAKDLIAFYAALGWIVKGYSQSTEYSTLCGTRFAFSIRFEK